MMPAAKHLDPVLGVDIHIIMIPSPAGPIPTPLPNPFIGFLLDPFDYVPIIGSTIYINTMHRGIAGTGGKTVPGVHMPLGGPFQKPPANECEMFMGSSTVLLDGDPASYLALPALSCQDIGMVAPVRINPKKKFKVKSLVLPTSVVLPIPLGMPVLIGGAPTISMTALGMKLGMAALGKALKAAAKSKLGRKIKNAIKKKKAKGKAKANAPCGTDAHPVDVVTGACVDTLNDYTSPGDFPLVWSRIYDSSECAVDGPLGRGFRHGYQRELSWLGDRFAYVDENGEETVFPPFEAVDQPWVVGGGWLLRRLDNLRYYLVGHHQPGHLFSFEHPSRRGLLVRLHSGRHHLSFRYDASARLIEVAESAGSTYRLAYDGAGHIAALGLEGEAGTQTLFRYEYDAVGCLRRGTDAYGGQFAIDYDHAGRLTRLVDRNGYAFAYTYDGAGRCIHTKGQDGLWEASFEYQPENLLTRVHYADGGVWTKMYDESGMVTRVIDPYGGELVRTVAEDGRVLSERDPAGRVTEFLYDFTGANVGKRDAQGHFSLPYHEEPFLADPLAERLPETPQAWELGRLVPPVATFRAGAGLPAWLADASFARPLFDLPPDGGAGQAGREYDLLGRRVRETDAQGRRQSWSYDAEGRVTEHRIDDAPPARTQYTSWNLVASETDRLGRATAYRYSIRGEITAVRDPGGTVTQYQRDRKERVVAVERNGVRRESYVWDVADRLSAKLGPDGRPLVEYVYGPDGLVRERKLASGETQTFKHDERGRVVLAVNPQARVRRTYDAWGNRVEESRDGLRIGHVYEGRELVETVLFDRYRIRYERHGRQALAVIDPCGGGQSLRWDRDGTVSRETPGGSREITRYGSDGRCLGKVARPARGDQVWQRLYRHDRAGRLVEAADNAEGSTRYAYDGADRLTGAERPGGTAERYEYDAGGNLVGMPGLGAVSLGTANQVAAANGDRYAYDARMHVAQCSNGLRAVEYEYDADDRLIACRTTGGEAWRADYDALGRRIRKRVGDQVSEYVWDGDRLAAEIGPDGSLRIYVYADGHAWVPLGFVDYPSLGAPPASGTSYSLYGNQIGVPLRVEDGRGETVWSARVAPYGALALNPGNRIRLDLRFPGHYHDPETGLHYNRHRYYSPELGRYIQSDPIGLAGGANVYAYTANPLAEVDLIGLTCHGSANNAKPGAAAEAPPRRIEAKKGGDVGQIADNAGMEKQHLEKLRQRSMAKNELIVVRATNPNSLPHHGKPGHISKPKDCKFKTDKGDGLVKKPPDPMSDGDVKHMKELEEKGWKVGENGEMLAPPNPPGQKVYGDHDLQGVYRKDETTGEYKQVNTNQPAFQKKLNNDVCPENQMFNHGANDNYKVTDPETGEKVMGRTPGADEQYVVTRPDGTVTQVNGTDELKQVYKEEGIPWPY